jgi:hypothetical protein
MGSSKDVKQPGEPCTLDKGAGLNDTPNVGQNAAKTLSALKRYSMEYRFGTIFTRTGILLPSGRSNWSVYSPRKPGPGCQ